MLKVILGSIVSRCGLHENLLKENNALESLWSPHPHPKKRKKIGSSLSFGSDRGRVEGTENRRRALASSQGSLVQPQGSVSGSSGFRVKPFRLAWTWTQGQMRPSGLSGREQLVLLAAFSLTLGPSLTNEKAQLVPCPRPESQNEV